MNMAACATTDKSVFFKRNRIDEAKAICARCPITEHCRAEADRITPEMPYERLHGVWGGESERERMGRQAAEKRARMRPQRRLAGSYR